MPLYEYSCVNCGPFSDFQTMNRWADPTDCPDCGDPSDRSLSSPQIANMDSHTRIAHQRNEKSADQPLVVNKKSDDHGAAGGHGHAHAHPSSTHTHKHGPSRPWMIGH